MTGSTLGTGLATAGAGARAVVKGRDEIRLKAAAERIRTAAPGAEVVAVAADVATADGAEKLVVAVPGGRCPGQQHRHLFRHPVLEIQDDEWRHFFEVNVLSGVRLARRYMLCMTARGHGRVVFVSSETAVNTPPDVVHYGTTKTAQLAVAKGLATAAAGTGVTVNSVLPGPTRTEGIEEHIAAMFPEAESFDAAQREFASRLRPTSLLRRLIEPAEVANLILYTSSDLASATTGAALKVEGGSTTRSPLRPTNPSTTFPPYAISPRMAGRATKMDTVGDPRVSRHLAAGDARLGRRRRDSHQPRQSHQPRGRRPLTAIRGAMLERRSRPALTSRQPGRGRSCSIPESVFSRLLPEVAIEARDALRHGAIEVARDDSGWSSGGFAHERRGWSRDDVDTEVVFGLG